MSIQLISLIPRIFTLHFLICIFYFVLAFQAALASLDFTKDSTRAVISKFCCYSSYKTLLLYSSTHYLKSDDSSDSVKGFCSLSFLCSVTSSMHNSLSHPGLGTRLWWRWWSVRTKWLILRFMQVSGRTTKLLCVLRIKNIYINKCFLPVDMGRLCSLVVRALNCVQWPSVTSCFEASLALWLKKPSCALSIC